MLVRSSSIFSLITQTSETSSSHGQRLWRREGKNCHDLGIFIFAHFDCEICRSSHRLHFWSFFPFDFFLVYPMDKTDTGFFTLSDNHHSSLLVKSRILWFSVKAVEICGWGNSNVSQCDSGRWPGGAWLVNKITRRVRNDYKWPQISNTLDTAQDCCYILSRAATKRQEIFTITEKAPIRAFSWLKAPTSAFTFKTLLRHYAKWALTQR